MYDRSSIQEGMTVRSADGHKLGKVFALGATEFQIEKGVFFPKDYLARYSDISDVKAHDVYLRHGKADLHWTEPPFEERPVRDRGVPDDITVESPEASSLHDELPFHERHARDYREGPRRELGAAAPGVSPEEERAVRTERAPIVTETVTPAGMAATEVPAPEVERRPGLREPAREGGGEERGFRTPEEGGPKTRS